MCGIAGLVDTSGLHTDDDVGHRLQQALHRLSARGPDGQGTWSDDRCIFGHRRLAIIDLSAAGDQPMSAFGQIITFNGEIFNFQELRAELKRLGHRFTSNSDTEVLLAGWNEWSEGLLDRLVGMFAFALWNPSQQSLTIIRDRFGEKPLFYWSKGTRLAFASDFLALEKIAGQNFPINPDALRLFFSLRYVPEPLSIAHHVHKLPPGHLLRFTGSRVTVERWYHRRHHESGATTTLDGATDMLRAAMDSAVSDRLVSDVPIGAFLSSGIDSAIVAATMARHHPGIRTFTVGFEGVGDYYEERPGAREIARHIGADHTEIVIDAAESILVLERLFESLDEPFADSSAVASFIVAREARRHIKVALSGDGADEVFGGYRKYQGELYAHLYHWIPASIRRSVIEPLVATLPEGKHNQLLEKFRRLKRFIAVAGRDRAGRHAGWAEQLIAAELNQLLVSGGGLTVENIVTEIQSKHHDTDAINGLLATDVDLVLPSDMLVKVDRTSMANGLEVRCPFLDQRVVEAAFSLPGSAKLKPGVGKWILRQAFMDRLPAAVFRNPKKGFEIPIADWLTGPLRNRVLWATDPAGLRRQGLFDPNVPRRWLELLGSGRQDTSWQLWSLIAFQSWATVHRRPEALP
jgi:asparagine synthase (glutamine-hydrolysing)